MDWDFDPAGQSLAVASGVADRPETIGSDLVVVQEVLL
jgi:hypothetical protein